MGSDPVFYDPNPKPLPEHEVIIILNTYLASLPFGDRMRLGMELVRCPCAVCSFLRTKIDPRLAMKGDV